MKENQCCDLRMSGYHQVRCSRTGTVERDGNMFCKTHDPVAQAERWDKKRAGWDAEANERADLRKLFPSDLRVYVDNAKKRYRVEFSFTDADKVREFAKRVRQ